MRPRRRAQVEHEPSCLSALIWQRGLRRRRDAAWFYLDAGDLDPQGPGVEAERDLEVPDRGLQPESSVAFEARGTEGDREGSGLAVGREHPEEPVGVQEPAIPVARLDRPEKGTLEVLDDVVPELGLEVDAGVAHADRARQFGKPPVEREVDLPAAGIAVVGRACRGA